MLRQNFLFWSEASKPSTLVMRDQRNSGSASEKRPPKTRSIPTRANPHVRCGAVSRKQVAAMRWEALQKRLEAVQERRRDREKETSRRMQAADRHNQARERRKVIRRCCCGWCWWRCCCCCSWWWYWCWCCSFWLFLFASSFDGRGQRWMITSSCLVWPLTSTRPIIFAGFFKRRSCWAQ